MCQARQQNRAQSIDATLLTRNWVGAMSVCSELRESIAHIEPGVVNAEVNGSSRLVARLNGSNHAQLVKIHGVDAAIKRGRKVRIVGASAKFGKFFVAEKNGATGATNTTTTSSTSTSTPTSTDTSTDTSTVRRECDSCGFDFRVYFRMMLGNVFADVGRAVQQQAVADDDERGLDDERAVVGVTLRRELHLCLWLHLCRHRGQQDCTRDCESDKRRGREKFWRHLHLEKRRAFVF